MTEEPNNDKAVEKLDKKTLAEYPELEYLRDKIREEARRNRSKKPLVIPKPNSYRY